MTEQIHPNEDAFGNHSCICSPPCRLRKQSSSCYNYHHASYGAFGTRTLALSRSLGCCATLWKLSASSCPRKCGSPSRARPIFIHQRGSATLARPIGAGLERMRPLHVSRSETPRILRANASRSATLSRWMCRVFWLRIARRPSSRIPPHRVDEFAVPDLAVGFYDWVIAFDHLRDRAWLFSTGYPELEESARIQQARLRINQVLHRLDQSIVHMPRSMSNSISYKKLSPQFPFANIRPLHPILSRRTSGK